MEKPKKAKWDQESHLTRLTFPGREEAEPDKYYVVGAIEWAIGLNPGYAILSCQNIRTEVLWIFEEFPFWTVRTSGMDQPLWEFFKVAWKKYLCRYFYYSNPKDHARYLRQVIKEPLIRSSPVFIEADYVTSAHERLDNLILEYQRLEKIKIARDAGNRKIIGNIFDQLSIQKQGRVQLTGGKRQNEDDLPAIKALRCLLAGIEKFPYQKPMEEQEIPHSYV
ncbi:MAG: hypothetical protein ACXABY_12240 [Candidatus Thorarchaeota archaeon]|jgi:hypothetical protein